MIKKLLLITALLSLSLGAVPPDFIKLLEYPDENVVMPAKLGVIQNDTLWLNPEAECFLCFQNFKELIKAQHEKNVPFILGITQSNSPEGIGTYQIYEAHLLNQYFFGNEYLGYQLIHEEVNFVKNIDPLTRNACHRIDYYMLAPGAESFLYVGNGNKIERLKELHCESFRYLEDNACILNTLGSEFAKSNSEIVEQDLHKTKELFERASALGDSTATKNLGIMYFQGQGVEQNFSRAAELFREAAECGNAIARYNLGLMYLHGKGLEQDFGEAKKLFESGAELGDAASQFKLGVMYFYGWGIEINLCSARKYWQAAERQDYGEAIASLGWMHLWGNGVRKDPKKAVKLFKRAAAQAVPCGIFGLGIAFFNGAGVPRDFNKAKELINQAADLECPEAIELRNRRFLL